MQFGRFLVPEPYNEPTRDYAPNSEDAKLMKMACEQLRSECPEIPCIIGGKEIRTGDIKKQVMPTDHKHVLCTFHQANEQTLKEAVQAALAAKRKWEEMSFESRAAIFLKAADLLAYKYRYRVNAATMLGQAKSVWQAEIDSACEVIDFWRFNVKFAEEIYSNQPPKNSKCVWNRMEYRPLEGYVVAISPFNFTAIGANLPTSPALMGNVVLWKPASTAILSNYLIFRILQEAGLPDGVINFVPGSGVVIGEILLNSPHFSGLHFTGSTDVFNGIMYRTASNLNNRLYRGYPRIVGETGGKDFHFAHSSADVDNFVNQTVRSAFEYQGQKCSACSRAYVPDSLWPEVREKMSLAISKMKMGQPDDFSSFLCAVIDRNSFNNIKGYIESARNSADSEIIIGGKVDDSIGYFVEPTVILSKNPKSKTMSEEIFGPVLTVYVYPSEKFEETLILCDETSPYSLTGSIFAKDRVSIELATKLLRNSSGNFYINDKCTGAVVGQQPFGGARASGTNDKAGSSLNLLRWVSPRSIKENFLPLSSWSYPHHSS